jgi:hypothetical protein
MKPKAVEMYPVYICNDCSSRHCETLDYVNKIGKILCGCGAVLDLTPIETFKVSPVFKTVSRNTKHGEKTKPEEIQDNDFLVIKELEGGGPPPPPQEQQKSKSFLVIEKQEYNKAVDLLTNLGWKQSESKKKVDKALKYWMGRTNPKTIDQSNFEEFANSLVFGK